ncbi:MAG: short-chain dehydrogenase/reductase [Acidobacteria bacterium]|nr:short-chain dehydrogenase/reductase [Acidobacteriota bacterium]
MKSDAADDKSVRYALVTGASTGLGKVFAQALAARKHNLVLVARSEDKLATLAADLKANYGILAETQPWDLAAPGAGQRLVQRLLQRNLRIDLLVNNAGFGVQGEFRKLDLNRQLEMIQLHNTSVVELTYLLLPGMIEKRSGGIINISSMAGLQAIPYATLYSATKSFLTIFSIALEREVGRHGVKVVTVCPGRLKAAPRGEQPRDAQRKKFPGGEQAPEDVVAQTLKMLDDGGGMLIPGLVNKFANVAQRFFPRRLVAKVVGKLSRPKADEAV